MIIKEKAAGGNAQPAEQPKPKPKKEGDEFKEKPAAW